MLVQPMESLGLFAVVRQGDWLFGVGVSPTVSRTGIQSHRLHPQFMTARMQMDLSPASSSGLGERVRIKNAAGARGT